MASVNWIPRYGTYEINALLLLLFNVLSGISNPTITVLHRSDQIIQLNSAFFYEQNGQCASTLTIYTVHYFTAWSRKNVSNIKLVQAV